MVSLSILFHDSLFSMAHNDFALTPKRNPFQDDGNNDAEQPTHYLYYNTISRNNTTILILLIVWALRHFAHHILYFWIKYQQYHSIWTIDQPRTYNNRDQDDDSEEDDDDDDADEDDDSNDDYNYNSRQHYSSSYSSGSRSSRSGSTTGELVFNNIEDYSSWSFFFRVFYSQGK